jgi:hypothetical protein
VSDQLWSDEDLYDASQLVHGYGNMVPISVARHVREDYEAELARLRSENERLRNAIWNLESAWFDYCQDVRPDVPEREIYDLLAINDGRLTMAEIEAQRDAPPQVQAREVTT